MPAPQRRKRPGPEETEACDCCGPACDCADCERCSQDAVELSSDWIPPPAVAKSPKAAKKRAPAPRKGR